MKTITWTPAAIAVGERIDGQAVALVLTDFGDETTIPMSRPDAHRIGRELVDAAALSDVEIAELEELDREHDARLH